MPPRASSSTQQGKQPEISRFFAKPLVNNASGKRARSPVDLTLDSDDEPQVKRVKVADKNAGTSTVGRAQSGESPIKKKYKFVTVEDSPPPKPKAVDPATKRKQEKRRQELKETLKQTLNQNTDRGSSPPTEANDTIGLSSDDTDSDGSTGNLRRRFESNLLGSKRTGATTSGKSKKKQELIGPSGQAYTPLELQVSPRPPYPEAYLYPSTIGQAVERREHWYITAIRSWL